jgi:hypothetical protein
MSFNMLKFYSNKLSKGKVCLFNCKYFELDYFNIELPFTN